MDSTATNLQGQFLKSLAIESSAQVTPLVVTPRRITLQWSLDGKTGQLDATSQDGIHFHARYGVAHDMENKCELTLYRAGEEQLLFGTWWDNVAATQGIVAFRLPIKVAEARGGRLAQPVPSEASDRQAKGNARPIDKPAPVSRSLATDRHSAAGRSSLVDKSLPASPPETARTIDRPVLRSPVAAPVPTVPASAQADHLLTMTPEQFAEQDRGALERELASLPLSAVFKLAHNALASEMKTLAGSVFEKRYGGLTTASSPAPAPRPPEPPEFKAIKRRSSRHNKSP